MSTSRVTLPSAIEGTGSALTDADYANLAKRWIDRGLAEAAGIRRVDSYNGAQFIGRRNNGSYAGLLIPYIPPGESRVREWRLRRDHPDIEQAADGNLKEHGKYMSPPGRGNMIYFAPGVSPDLLKAVNLLIVVTEGEFKSLALWCLANHESDTPRFLPLGLGGVWNWRGTIGKTTGPNGERRDVKGAIPDLGLITWESRRVIIAFDADGEKKPQVEIAKAELRRELRIRGAEVAIISWDIAQGKGIDDLLANVGPSKVLELIESADWEQESEDEISVSDLAEAITAKHRFAKDGGGRLYIHRGGCYQPDGASSIHQQVKRLLQRMHLLKKWTSRKSEEVVKYIAVDAPLLWECPPLDVVNVQNGLLNVDTQALSPHSPDFLSPVQLPVEFNREARCPGWEKFIGEVFPGDAEAIAWEIPSWLMTPDCSIQKAVLLIGDGANGKSTYLRGVLAFLGRRNVAAVSLHKLEEDRFSVARLVGRLANVCPDLPSRDLASTSGFKAITGGDALQAERKFEESFEFVPYARLIFSANHPPKSQDASSAFFRRWVVVPFERTFLEGAPGTIPRDQLDASLSDPAELSGVLNKALDAIRSIRQKGLSESESTRRALDEFRQATDPLAVWLDRNSILQSDAFVSQDHLCRVYNQDCSAKGRPAVSKTAFGRAIAQLRPTVEKRQRTVNDVQYWCYIGMGLLLKDQE